MYARITSRRSRGLGAWSDWLPLWVASPVPTEAAYALSRVIPPTSSWYALFHVDTPIDLARNMVGVKLTPAQRDNIAQDCADNRVKASGGKLSRAEAVAQCLDDVNRAAPPKFNWAPWVVGGVIGVGALILIARR